MRLSLGSVVWVFDEDRRVYAKGRSGPIYREHFIEHRIIAETVKSWILDDGTKINKGTKQSARDYRGYSKRIFDEAQVDDSCFVNDERHRIVGLVQHCNDAAVLRRILRVLEEPQAADAVDPIGERVTE